MLKSIFWIASDGLLSWLSGKACCDYLKVTKRGYQHLKYIKIERDTLVFAFSKGEITFRGKHKLPDKLEEAGDYLLFTPL